MAYGRELSSSQVERAAAAARLAALSMRVGALAVTSTEQLVSHPRGVTSAEERTAFQARLEALEARMLLTPPDEQRGDP